ncbi:MAG: hypothetical protein V6D39_17505 [Dolichospermum lemmermannii FEM_B0920]|jgi:Skp family chaperone for outer membrane proteins
MELLDLYKQRLKDLEDNIAKDNKLLNEYEGKLRYTSDPRDIGRYKEEIKRQQEYVIRYQKELNELNQKLTNYQPSQMLYVEKQLQQMDEKVDFLVKGQIAIYKKQAEIRQELSSRYNDSEKAIIASITKQLNRMQLVLTDNLLQALDDNMVSEPEMQQMLAVLEERLPSLPPSQAAIVEIIKDPEIDVRHKLKVTLPIIPLLVEYEGEVEIGNGFNIKSAWEQLLTKLRRK